MLKRKGYTLLEMLVVLLIISILAALAWPKYVAIKEKTLNREAKAILLLIRAAEKDYRMQYGYYYPHLTFETSLSNINRDLKLSLPQSANWSIRVDSSTLNSEFATATRSGADSRYWIIYFSADTTSCFNGAYCS